MKLTGKLEIPYWMDVVKFGCSTVIWTEGCVSAGGIIGDDVLEFSNPIDRELETLQSPGGVGCNCFKQFKHNEDCGALPVAKTGMGEKELF